MRPRPHVPEKRSFLLRFRKNTLHTWRIVFARPQAPVRFQFVLQDGNDKPVFSHAFSVAVFTGYLWMVGQRGEKNLRSQTKPDRYGWGQ